jgi:hypothetical protein
MTTVQLLASQPVDRLARLGAPAVADARRPAVRRCRSASASRYRVPASSTSPEPNGHVGRRVETRIAADHAKKANHLSLRCT